TFALSNTSADPITAIVEGTVLASTLTIAALTNVAGDATPVTITNAAQLQSAGTASVSSVGDIKVQLNSAVSRSASVGLQPAGNILITAGSTVTGNTGVTMTGTGPSSSISIDTGSTVTAGVLAPSAPLSGPLSSSDILSAGSVIVSNAGSGGINLEATGKVIA